MITFGNNNNSKNNNNNNFKCFTDTYVNYLSNMNHKEINVE